MMTHNQKGFTLIEVMIGLVVGLFILGGVLTVFSSTQHTALVKQRLDNAQEAIRFGHYTIARLVRNSDAFEGVSDGDTLVISYPDDISGVQDCIGGNIASSTTTTFQVQNDRLQCNGEDIAVGFSSLSLTYGIIDSSGSWTATSVSDATSVRVVMNIQPHEEFDEVSIPFVATMRNKILD